MANIIDLPNCASPDSVFNTGVPLCDLKKGKILGVILADKGVTFTKADCASVATFLAAVLTKTTAARGGRVYPIWNLKNFEDNTGDPQTGSTGNLTTATIVTQDAVPVFSFGYGGGEAQHKRLAAMSGGSYDVFFVDSQYAVYGTDSNGEFAGFSVEQAYVYTSKFIVTDAVNQYRFRLTLNSITEYRENSRFVVANSTLASYTGLINVVLDDISVSNTNAKTIQAIADGGSNMQELYGTQLANSSNWVATNLQTGANVTITTVAQDSANKAFTVTLDSTTWSGLATGDKVQINLAAAATLAASGVKPFEGIAIVVTK